MKMASRGPGPIPNRWLYCPRKSETIIVNRFLAFKTPLSLAYKDQMPIDCVFTPEMIFGYVKALNLKVGQWIDLTNTKRFYDRTVVEKLGAQYIKLQCRGHGETPSPEQTHSFIELVDKFIEDHPLDVIGVHCTHGFNRTGFLIVSYMVERFDCSVEGALALFAKARPPGIYKQDYINELFRRYQPNDDPSPAPELPNWCLEFDDSNDNNDSGNYAMPQKRQHDDNEAHTSNNQQHTDNGAGDVDDDDQIEDVPATSNGPTRKKRRRELVVKNATFMTGVPGVVLVTDQSRLEELQAKVRKMCGWEKSGFPGSQPVSMDRHNLKLLHEKPYRVSWKADGTRYMMLINKRDEVYFFDRNNSCFQAENVTFVKAGNLHEHLEDTLLDGEMVLDKFQGQTTPRYLIYDIVTISGEYIGKMPFFENRLNCIKKEIIDPRSEAMRQGIINRQSEPFGIRNKDFWEIRYAESLLGEKFAKSLSHEPDGLIFQPSDLGYVAGACPFVLKWKPHNMNSIDFRLKISTEEGIGILRKKVGLLYVGGRNEPFDRIKYTKELKELDNKIIECTVNPQGQWEIMRERTDKVLPNSFDTATSVCDSIRYPITKECLLDYIVQYGYRKKSELMPPPTAVPKSRPPQQQQQHQQQNHHHHQQQQQQHHHQQQQQQHHQQQQQQQHHQQEQAFKQTH